MKITSIGFCVAFSLFAASTSFGLDFDVRHVSVRTCGADAGEAWNLWANGYAGEWVLFPADGEYCFEVEAAGQQAWGIGPIFRLYAGENFVAETYVADPSGFVTFKYSSKVKAGTLLVSVMFRNDYVDGQQDRNLFLRRISVSAAAKGAAAPEKGAGPAQWTGPEERPPFADWTAECGLALEGGPPAPDVLGGVLCDFDGDGRVDIVLAGALWRNAGGGRFEKTADVPRGDCYAWGDADGDGDLDLFVGAPGDADALLRNDSAASAGGAPKFTDVTKASGLRAPGPPRAAAWGDYDNDGDLDLYAVQYEEPMFTAHHDVLNRNEGVDPATKAPRFTDATRDAGMDAAGARVGTSAMWCDFDGDGLMDLYVTNYRLQDDFLWKNQGRKAGGAWTFQDVAGPMGVAKGGPRKFAHGTGVRWADYDDDGDLDLFVSNLKHSSKNPQFEGQNASVLYRYDKGRFTDVTGLMEFETDPRDELDDVCPAFFDADNDGDLDLYVGGSAQGGSSIYSANDGEQYHGNFYWNEGGIFRKARFKSIEIEDSWGVSAGDLDGDGFVDLLVGSGNWSIKDVFKGQSLRPPGDTWSCETSRVRVLRNTLRDRFPDNRWMNVRLEGKKNRFGIGAVVRVRLSDGRTLTRLVFSGTTSEGCSGDPIVLHFGLGTATVQWVSVVWPGTSKPVTYKKPEGRDSFEPCGLAVLREK